MFPSEHQKYLCTVMSKYIDHDSTMNSLPILFTWQWMTILHPFLLFFIKKKFSSWLYQLQRPVWVTKSQTHLLRTLQKCIFCSTNKGMEFIRSDNIQWKGFCSRKCYTAATYRWSGVIWWLWENLAGISEPQGP